MLYYTPTRIVCSRCKARKMFWFLHCFHGGYAGASVKSQWVLCRYVSGLYKGDLRSFHAGTRVFSKSGDLAEGRSSAPMLCRGPNKLLMDGILHHPGPLNCCTSRTLGI